MDGTTNIQSLIYRKMVQDQNDGITKLEIDKLRSERFAHLYMTGGASGASGDVSSFLCSFGTLTSGGVKFRLKSVVVLAASGGHFYLDDGTTRVAGFGWASAGSLVSTVYTGLEGIYFSSDCRIIMSAGVPVNITLGGIIERTGGY